MNTMHQLLAYLASFGMVFSAIYLVMEYTVGFIPAFRRWTLPGNIPGRRLIFSAVALLLILKFVSFRIS